MQLSVWAKVDQWERNDTVQVKRASQVTWKQSAWK